MTRVTFLLRRLDVRDRMMLVGILVAAALISFGVGCVTAAHRARIERERALEDLERATRRVYEHRGWVLTHTRRITP